MQATSPSRPDWRDAAAYAALLAADRSLFAWEWLRRDPGYRTAAESALAAGALGDVSAAAFGLVCFEPPDRAVPVARPLWRAEVHPLVLAVEPMYGRQLDAFSADRLRDFATLVTSGETDHLLLSDGLRTVRLDGPLRTFSGGRACLRYQLEGLAAAEPRVLTLRRFLALCRHGRFRPSLHPREARAQRWILLLRALDAWSAGVSQREIAEVLVHPSAAAPQWRSREPSLRSQTQRLVRSARAWSAGGYRQLLATSPSVG